MASERAKKFMNSSITMKENYATKIGERKKYDGQTIIQLLLVH